MSRTIRRKNAYTRHHYVTPASQIDAYDLARFDANNPKECCKRMAAWFHGDKHSGAFGVPRWYRSERNKVFSRQADEDLYRCLVSGEWDNHLPVRYKRDAGYFWW